MAVTAYKKQCQPITEALVLGTEVGLVEVADGKKTFSIWISRLKDARARALIRARIARIEPATLAIANQSVNASLN